MVNKDFYITMNGLVSQATNGTAPEITDYDSFIEAGKKITDIKNIDFQNNFINALMNRIALVINTARNYVGAYSELTRGTLEYGNTIELIIQKFYNAQAASFVDLQNGGTVDQFKIYKPEVDVEYYVDSVAYKIPLTVHDDQLKKAFLQPNVMDSFVGDTFMYVLNSNELKREAGRIALVAKLIITNTSTEPATSVNKPAQYYKLLTLYNEIAGTELTAENCLFNEEFVKFAVKTIKQVTEKTKKVSESYNKTGIKTFTRPEDRHLFVNSAMVSSMEAYIKTNNYNPESSMLKDYIDVPYWQNEDTPFTVTYANPEYTEGGDEPESITSVPVIAVMCDKFAIGEYVRKQDMRTSPFNADGEYWNAFLNVELKYLVCESANSVVFALA